MIVINGINNAARLTRTKMATMTMVIAMMMVMLLFYNFRGQHNVNTAGMAFACAANC